VQVDGLHRAEGAFHVRQALVGGYRGVGIELRCRDIRADYVQAVQCRLGLDRVELAPIAE